MKIICGKKFTIFFRIADMVGPHRATLGHQSRGQEPVAFGRFLARYPRFRSEARYPELYQIYNYTRGTPYLRVRPREVSTTEASSQGYFPRYAVSNSIRPTLRRDPGPSSDLQVRNLPTPHTYPEQITRVNLESDSSDEEEEDTSTEEHRNTSLSSSDETSSTFGDQGQGDIAVEVVPPAIPPKEPIQDQLPPQLLRPVNRLQAYWRAREDQNTRISEMANRMIAASWRASTEQTYGTYWRRWLAWTTVNVLPAMSSVLENVLDFLASLMSDGLSWQYISGARSTLSSTLPPVEGFKIGDHPTVCRLVKGAFELKPPIKPLVPQWSVNKVLRQLDSWDEND